MSGRFILLADNVDRGNPRLPYPILDSRWQVLARSIGLTGIRLLATVPRRCLREISSALSLA